MISGRLYTMALVMCGMTMALAGKAQSDADSLTEEFKNRILGRFKNFTFGFYIDAYTNQTIDNKSDTSNIVAFAGNCPVQDQIRLNLAAIEMYYNADKVRGKFALQWGDAPNLLASPDNQWVKTIRQANFGFRVVRDLWIDLGYIFNPIGWESSWPVLNQISYVTVGGYYEPGSVLGAKISYKFSEKFSAGIMAGNPFSLAYSQNNKTYGFLFCNYRPWKKLAFINSMMFGNNSLKRDSIRHAGVYNNLIITYDPFEKLQIVGQFDYAIETNAGKPPDTTRIAQMFSGFLQAKYLFNEAFSVAARYEWFTDPDGFLSGVNPLTGRGKRLGGFGISFEYKPVKIGYVRVAYRYMDCYPGSKEYYSHTSDYMNAIIITTGVRF